jgi:hypothetical protein
MFSGRAGLRREFSGSQFSRSRSSVLLLTIVGLVMVGVALAVCGYIPTPADGAPSGQVLYPLRVDGLVGYVNRAGEMVVKPQFTTGAPFVEGLALVTMGDKGTYGFIDTAGKLAIDAQFPAAEPFSEGLVAITPKSPDGNYVPDLWGVVDPFGRDVVPPIYD